MQIIAGLAERTDRVEVDCGPLIQHFSPGRRGPTARIHARPARESALTVGGQSSGPLETDRPWDAYTDDHISLMDHLGIRGFHGARLLHRWPLYLEPAETPATTSSRPCWRSPADAADVLGAADILVNNASVYPQVKLLEMRESDWGYLLDINLKAGCFATIALVKALMAAGKSAGYTAGGISRLRHAVPVLPAALPPTLSLLLLGAPR